MHALHTHIDELIQTICNKVFFLWSFTNLYTPFAQYTHPGPHPQTRKMKIEQHQIICYAIEYFMSGTEMCMLRVVKPNEHKI